MKRKCDDEKSWSKSIIFKTKITNEWKISDFFFPNQVNLIFATCLWMLHDYCWAINKMPISMGHGTRHMKIIGATWLASFNGDDWNNWKSFIYSMGEIENRVIVRLIWLYAVLVQKQIPFFEHTRNFIRWKM